MTPRKAAHAKRKGQRILVIDDEPIVLEAARLMLEHLGHEVQVAGSAPDGLEAFQEAEFDVVLTDYQMPEMRGDELASLLRKQRPEQPIGMITAYAEVLPPMKDIDLVISKPFLMQHLKEAIEKLVRAT